MSMNRWRTINIEPLLKPYVDPSKLPSLQVALPDFVQYWNCGVRTIIKSAADFDIKNTIESLSALSKKTFQSPNETKTSTTVKQQVYSYKKQTAQQSLLNKQLYCLQNFIQKSQIWVTPFLATKRFRTGSFFKYSTAFLCVTMVKSQPLHCRILSPILNPAVNAGPSILISTMRVYFIYMYQSNFTHLLHKFHCLGILEVKADSPDQCLQLF